MDKNAELQPPKSPFVKGDTHNNPPSKGGKGGCYAISAFCGELNCYRQNNP